MHSPRVFALIISGYIDVLVNSTMCERSTVKPGKPKFIETNFCVRNRYMFGSIHFQIKLKYFLHWDFLKCLAYSIMVYTELGLDRFYCTSDHMRCV